MTHPRKQFIISVMSEDRIGIVRDVAQSISELAGDIADLRQSVLRGYFTMILLAAFPPSVTADTIKSRLSHINLQSKNALEITVKPVQDRSVIIETSHPDDTYVLTASGEDRLGFVADVSRFCADHAINILDLSTTVADGSYIMILLVDVSQCQSLEMLHRQLDAFGQQTGLNLVLQHHDIFKATNEVSLL